MSIGAEGAAAMTSEATMASMGPLLLREEPFVDECGARGDVRAQFGDGLVVNFDRVRLVRIFGERVGDLRGPRVDARHDRVGVVRGARDRYVGDELLSPRGIGH